MNDHKDLELWKQSVGFAIDVYRSTESFPAHELYGLTGQIRRAAVSVPSNVAEGAARGSRMEFIRYLRIALGSLAELETQLLIARELRYGSDLEALMSRVDPLRRMASGLIRSLKGRRAAHRG